jgi:hypothetical protein
MTGKNLTLIYIAFLQVFFYCSSPANAQHPKWNSYTAATPSRNLYITFQYPVTLSVNSVENGVCLNRINKAKSKPEDKNFPTQWCIWFMDASRNINDCVENEKNPKEKHSKINLVESRDSLTVAGITALRVTLINEKNKKPYVEMIFFEKEGILFEIDNRKFDSKDFEKFLNSITF